MANAALGRQRIEHVAHHRAVRGDVLRLRGPARPCREEDMGRRDRLQRGFDAGGVQKVRRHGDDAIAHVRRAPGQAIDLPAAANQLARRVAAGDPARADDKCSSLHVFLHPAVRMRSTGYRLRRPGCECSIGEADGPARPRLDQNENYSPAIATGEMSILKILPIACEPSHPDTRLAEPHRRGVPASAPSRHSAFGWQTSGGDRH